jgi:Putative bacterial sensory transduction regulator
VTGAAGTGAAASGELQAALSSLGVEFSSPRDDAFLVRLEGQHKLATMTWLIVGAHSLQVEAFFCRQPDENHAAFYRFLLERGGRMYGVHFALDPAGDVYLVGRLPLTSITAAEIDRVLGCVLSYSDDNFDPALMLGFASSIRREWAWRVRRGESLANLRPYARLVNQDPVNQDPVNQDPVNQDPVNQDPAAGDPAPDAQARPSLRT